MKCTVVVGGIENINWKSKVADTFVEDFVYEVPKNFSIKDLQKSVNTDVNEEVKLVLSEGLLNHLDLLEQLQSGVKILLVYAPLEYVLAREAEQNGEPTNAHIEHLVMKWISDSKAIWKMYLSDPDKVIVCGLDLFDLASEKVWQKVFGTVSFNAASNNNNGDSLAKVEQNFQFLATQLLRIKYQETARISSEVRNILEDLDTVSLMINTSETDSIEKNQISKVSDVCLISLNVLAGCVKDFKKKDSKFEQNKRELKNLKERKAQEIDKLELDLAEALDANFALQVEVGKQRTELDRVNSQNKILLEEKEVNQAQFNIIQSKLEALQAETQLLTLQVGQLEEEIESVDAIASSVPALQVENKNLISTNSQLKQEISKLEEAKAAGNNNAQEIELLDLQVNQLHEELEETYLKLTEQTDRADYRLSKIIGLEDKLIKVNTDYDLLRNECSSHKHRIKELQSKLTFSNRFENNHELLNEVQSLQERLESVYLNKNVMSIALSQGKNYKASSM